MKKYLIGAAVVVAVFVVRPWLRPYGDVTPPPVEGSRTSLSLTNLTAGELKVEGLVKAAKGSAILTEELVREKGDVRMVVSLDPTMSKVAGVSINLSSLARKQEKEGLSDEAVKAGLKF